MTKHGEPALFFNRALAYEGDECLLWPFGRDTKGAGQIYLDGRIHSVPRVICERVHGKPPTPRHHAAHSCGQGHRGCCNKRHLRWATPRQNSADQILHGTAPRGERSGTAKLLEGEVREIRRLLGRLSKRAIADEFGVSERTIHDIETRKTWAWLD